MRDVKRSDGGERGPGEGTVSDPDEREQGGSLKARGRLDKKGSMRSDHEESGLVVQEKLKARLTRAGALAEGKCRW